MSKDNELQKDVQAELRWDPSVTSAHIGVTAKAGVVTLTGHVESFAEKHAAENAVRRVKGVKGVAQEMEVRLPFESQRTDEDIAEAAIERLAWDSFVPNNAIEVSVEKGWVTLTGQVNSAFQKVAAEQDVRRLLGVIGVSNQTTVKPDINAQNVREDIMYALDRSWSIKPNTIDVKAETGGVIRLSGTVMSPYDRNMAAATAWASPGATSVENDIIVL